MTSQPGGRGPTVCWPERLLLTKQAVMNTLFCIVCTQTLQHAHKDRLHRSVWASDWMRHKPTPASTFHPISWSEQPWCWWSCFQPGAHKTLTFKIEWTKKEVSQLNELNTVNRQLLQFVYKQRKRMWGHQSCDMCHREANKQLYDQLENTEKTSDMTQSCCLTGCTNRFSKKGFSEEKRVKQTEFRLRNTEFRLCPAL